MKMDNFPDFFNNIPDFFKIFFGFVILMIILSFVFTVIFYFKGFSLLGAIFNPQKRNQPNDEQKVLAVAEEKNGQLTITEVVLHCQFSLKKSQFVLDKLVKQGIARVSLNPQGEKIYVFPGLIKENKYI